MCGILGFVSSARDARWPDALVRGTSALAHRGPDATGRRTVDGHEATCALAATRLRVLDLSAAADQPMSNEDGSVWVSYNGELYNFAELRADLRRAGHQFRSGADTEVLVHLYEAEAGDLAAMLRRLRGMFAFALFDAARGRLVVARDRLGIKPLYYARLTGGGLAVSSEVRALAATGLVDTAPDPLAVAGFLGWGAVPAPRTILAGVRSLMPGHCGVWHRGAWSESAWWVPELDPDPALDDAGEATRLLGAALEDAAARQLVADRPVGVFLSGGVDSGVVARLASRAGGSVRALTVTFPDVPGAGEDAAAAATAAAIGARHTLVPITGAELAAHIPEALAAMDQPTWDGVNSWVVCRAARAEGLVVCLTGLGGDELAGGYPSFRIVPRLAPFLSAAQLVPAPLRRAVARAAARRYPGGRAARLAGAHGGLPGAYQAMRGAFAPAEVAALLGAPAASAYTIARSNGGTPAEQVGLLEMTHYLPDQLLRDTDTMSMAHSLEVRVPLLDDIVVRVAMATPASVRFAAGKRWLAGAAGLSADRPKRPFALPFDQWSRGSLHEQIREGLLSDALPLHAAIASGQRQRLWAAFEAGRVHWSRPWAINVLRRWPQANGLRW